MSSPTQFAAFSMILLRYNDRYLLLQRAQSKRFAPGRWTGIGGRVESDEFDDLTAAALRELREETGIEPAAVRNFALRRALLQARPEHPLTILLYFTGDVAQPVSPKTPEGELHWMTQQEIETVDVIENTAQIIPLLIDDMRRGPDAHRDVITGAAAFDPDGTLVGITWSG